MNRDPVNVMGARGVRQTDVGCIMGRLLSRVVFCICLLYGCVFAYAEGTNEVRTNAKDSAYVQLVARNGSGKSFAYYGGLPDYRMNVHVCAPGEVVQMGFSKPVNIDGPGQPQGKIEFRVKDPQGNIVFGPQLLQSASDSSHGQIYNYQQAVSGPQSSTVPNGYRPFSFVANTVGDYFIEFRVLDVTPARDSANIVFRMFDVTVMDQIGEVRKGRLWSKAWMLNTNNFTNPYNGSLYVLSNDNIVTKVDMNGVQPYEFIISANNTGTANTGNIEKDRKSVYNANLNYPLYKIFLNDPDTACYKSGVIGAIGDNPTLTGCAPNYKINFSVNAPGQVKAFLDLNKIPGYQNGTKDRLMQVKATAGDNSIAWDGKDGLGNVVNAGDSIPISLEYLNGLTHMPIFDVERNTKGYKVSYVRPIPSTGSQIEVYWDDSDIRPPGNVPKGTVNLSGCSGSCHTWQLSQNDNNQPDYGNLNTINTWWYINSSSKYIVVDFPLLDIDANRSTPGKGKDNDTTICASAKEIQLKGKLKGNKSAQWLKLGGTGSIGNDTMLTTNYSFSANDLTRKSIAFVLSSKGNCGVISDTIAVYLEAVPRLQMPPPSKICSSNTLLSATASIANVAGVRWEGNGGRFNDSLKTSIQYIPTQEEIDSVFIKLYAHTLPKPGQLCPMLRDSTVFELYVPATLQLPADTILCAPTEPVVLSLRAQSIGSDSVVWRTDGYALTSRKGLANHLQIDGSNAFMVYATAYKKGCNPAMDSLKVGFEAAPLVLATAAPTCLPNLQVNLSGNATIAGGKSKGIWASSGNGRFVFSTDSVSANGYIPSKQDSATGTVLLQLTASPKKYCPAKDTSIAWKIIPLPKAYAGIDTVVCTNTMIFKSSFANADWKYLWKNGRNGSILSTNATVAWKVVTDASLWLAVTNSRNCVVEDSAVVEAVVPPQIQLPAPFCFDAPTLVKATIGLPPGRGRYQWKRNDTLIADTAPALLVTSPGRYQYEFEYKGGCVTNALTHLFASPQLRVKDTSGCENEPITIVANPIANASYFWGGSNVASALNTVALNIGSGIANYKVLIRDENGCKDSSYVNIKAYPYPEFKLLGQDLCLGEAKTLKAVLADPTLTNRYSIDPVWTRDGVQQATARFDQLDYNDAGNFRLTLAIKGCRRSQAAVINTYPRPVIELPNKYNHCFESDPPLAITPNEQRHYRWYTSEGLLDTNRTIRVSPQVDTKYGLMVRNEFGCKDSTALLVRKVCPPRLFVPNVITPESHDVNSALRIFGAHYTHFEITIFSRWGEVIFHTTDPQNAWDGIYRNENMPIGNYQWLVTYEGDTEEFKGPFKKTGDVTIVR